jgi:hypothetical protein
VLVRQCRWWCDELRTAETPFGSLQLPPQFGLSPGLTSKPREVGVSPERLVTLCDERADQVWVCFQVVHDGSLSVLLDPLRRRVTGISGAGRVHDPGGAERR